MMANKIHLISSVTCPWVQRSAITLRIKKVDADVTYINLRDKPDWFLEISPHGKVPVLKVDDQVLFESNAILEYLDESFEPHLHPADPIKRARNRAWNEFIRDFSTALTSMIYSKSPDELAKAIEAAPARIGRVEEAIASERGNDGPYFNGDTLCLVDATYGPFFQRFAIAESVLKTGVLEQFPLVKSWSDALLANDAIVGAVASNFAEEYKANLVRRGSYAATLLQPASAVA
jgi:glutathione S-transferase